MTSGRLGPNFEPLIVTVPKAALVRSAASVTLGSNRSFSATQQHQLKGVVTPILTAQSRLLLCHLMPRNNFVSDLWGNRFVGRHYHLPKGRPFRRASKSGSRTRARRLEFWGRFDAGRSNLPGLRLLASDQGLRLASQSRGYLQKDDETQPKSGLPCKPSCKPRSSNGPRHV